MHSPLRGFTLIELLVVIAIIGMLSSIVLASLNTARAKARDAKRASDMHQVANALELYASSNNGLYPGGTFACGSGLSGGTYSEPFNADSNFVSAMVPAYMPSLPVDPKPYDGNPGASSAYGYTYGVSSDRRSYILLTYPEKAQPAGWCTISSQLMSGQDPCNWHGSYSECRL